MAFSDDIDQLEEVLRVYRQLGAEREPRLSDLMAPFRRLERVEEVQMRRAPFSSNERKPARLFLFNDLVLLAEELPEPEAPAAAPLLGRLFGSFSRMSVRRNTPAAPDARHARRSNASRGSTRSFSTDASADASLKLEEVMELHKCSVKRANAASGEAGFQLTHVYRVRDSNDKPATRIDMVEVWCDSLDQADALFADVDRAIDTLRELQEREEALAQAQFSDTDGAASDGGSSVGGSSGRPSIVSAAGTGDPGPRRKWASAKGKMRRRHGTLNSQASGAGSVPESDDESAPGGRGARSDSHSSGGLSGSHHGQDKVAGGLTLADLEARYRQAAAAPEAGRKDKDASFAVHFGEGPMGFSLSSSAGLGVIIGRVAAGSMAEVGGVEVGDRLSHVGSAEVALDTNWRDAVEQIKQLPRPVELTFLRNFSVNSQVAAAEEQAKRASKQRPAGGLRASRAASKASLTTSEGGTPGRRKWAERRKNANLGARLTSLEDLANMYKSSTAAANAEDEAATHDGASVTSSSSAARRARTAQEQREHELEDALEAFEVLLESPSEQVRACAATLREIFETERAYVRDLGLIVGDYLLPVRRTVRRVRCSAVEAGSTFCEHRNLRSKCSRTSHDSRPIMEPEDVKAVFLNVETLVKVNSELLTALRVGVAEVARSKGPAGASVTDLVRVFAPAFVRVMPFFRIYSLYCHAYAQAIDKLLVARARNRHLDALIKEREAKSASSLQHLLIKPVQRICRYPMLFKGLLKAVVPYVAQEIDAGADVDQLDALVEDLEKALSVVQKIADAVNDKVGEQASLERMMDIYAELGGEAAVPELVTPSRRFLDKTDVLLRAMPFDASSPLRHELMYVFNDHLVFARGTNAGYGTLSSRTGGSLRKLRSGGSSLNLTRAASNGSKKGGGSLTKMMGFRRASKDSARKKSGASAGDRSSVGASTLSRNSRSHSVSSGSSGPGRTSGGVRSVAAAVTMRADLRRAKVAPIAAPDETDCYGVVLSFVTRVRAPTPEELLEKEAAKETKDDRPGRKSSSAATAARKASTTSTKSAGKGVETTVTKLQLWFPTEEKRDQMARMLSAQIENLVRLEDITKQASVAVGAKVSERTWKTRQRSRHRPASRYAAAPADA